MEERNMTGDLVVENRQLQRALDVLLTEMEEKNYKVNTSKVREKMPDTHNNRNAIQPPWEREGYESKQAWLDDKRE